MLLDKGHVVTALVNASAPFEFEEQYQQPIHTAATLANMNVVKALINANSALINKQDNNGNTPSTLSSNLRPCSN